MIAMVMEWISLGLCIRRSFVISTLIVSIAFGGASEVMVEGFRISVWLRSSFAIAITSSISTISSITIVVMAAIAMCICIRCGFGLRIRLGESRREKQRSKKQESGGSWKTKAGIPSKSSH